MTEREIEAFLRRVSRRKQSRMAALREAFTGGYNAAHEDQMQMRIRDAQDQRAACERDDCQSTATKATPATDSEVQYLMGAIHQHHNIFGGECSHCAPIVASVQARIAADAEIIKAREAAYDQAQEGLKHARKQEAEMRETIRQKDEEIEDLHLMAQGVKHYAACHEGDCLRCRLEAARAQVETLRGAVKYTLDHSLLYRVAGWENLQAALAATESKG